MMTVCYRSRRGRPLYYLAGVMDSIKGTMIDDHMIWWNLSYHLQHLFNYIRQVAVKYNEQYYEKHGYKFCTVSEVTQVNRLLLMLTSYILQRVVREARIWSRMKHRNIVPLLGLWSNFSVKSVFHCFVSPWFEEGSLKKCYETTRLSIRQKLQYVSLY